MQLTKNFTRKELLVSNTATRLGLSNEPASAEIEANLLKTAQFLQEIRDKLGKPITVLSVYRAPSVNKAVGGSKTSAHMKALAADIQVDGMANRDLALFIAKHFEYDQLILEFPPNGWVHVGIPTEHSKRGQMLTALKVNSVTHYQSGIA